MAPDMCTAITDPEPVVKMIKKNKDERLPNT